MAGLFADVGVSIGQALVGQGDLRPEDMNVGTRSRPSPKDGRITDYQHHYKRWLNEMQRYRDAAKAYK